MTQNLIERLRARYTVSDEFSITRPLCNPDGPEAATLLERQQRMIEEAREALIMADLKIRSFPGADQSDVEFIRTILASPALVD